MAHKLWSMTKYKKLGYGISMVVPYRSAGDEYRDRNYEWLRSYYKFNLPGAEWVQGHTDAVPFNKCAAVNDGYRRASGDIITILDADAFLDTSALLSAAQFIRDARAHGNALWFMPYRRLYRLTQLVSSLVHQMPPNMPWDEQLFGDEETPSPWEYENTPEQAVRGHMFGAMVQVHPREAFDVTRGMDERFAGWGGEDISFARAVDTLFGRHQSLNYSVMHLWHPQFQGNANQWSTSRSWVGQDTDKPNPNEALAQRYFDAYNDYGAMHKLVIEERSK